MSKIALMIHILKRTASPSYQSKESLAPVGIFILQTCPRRWGKACPISPPWGRKQCFQEHAFKCFIKKDRSSSSTSNSASWLFKLNLKNFLAICNNITSTCENHLRAFSRAGSGQIVFGHWFTCMNKLLQRRYLWHGSTILPVNCHWALVSLQFLHNKCFLQFLEMSEEAGRFHFKNKLIF